MAKRFKILETAIKKYKAPVNVSGTPFFKYDQFQKGLTDFHPDQPDRGKSENRILTPFAVPSTEAPYRLTRTSTRAVETSLGLTGFTLGDLALANESASVEVNSNREYIPAKVTVFVGTGATTNVSATENKVTGTPYKRKVGTSFTLPFGQGATPGTTVLNAMGYLSNKADSTGKSVTFKPERFYGSGR